MEAKEQGDTKQLEFLMKEIFLQVVDIKEDPESKENSILNIVLELLKMLNLKYNYDQLLPQSRFSLLLLYVRAFHQQQNWLLPGLDQSL